MSATVQPVSDDDALAQREARLRRLYESTPAMLHTLDNQGRFIEVSDTWLAKMGYAREEVIGRSSAEFMTEASLDYARNVVLPEFLRTGRVSDIDYQLVRRDGSLIDVRLSSIMERDDYGRPLRSVSIMEDVTEKHAVERALHANQERLALATQANGIGIWELDVASQRLTWSEQMFRIFDIAREDFRGRFEDWLHRVHPDDLQRSQEALQAALTSDDHPLDCDFRIIRGDGLGRHVVARATVFRDSTRRAVRVLGVNYDITDHKRMARELAEKHELLRVTLNSIGDAVITTDADGKVQWLNPVAERMTGWRTDEACGQALLSVYQVVDENTRAPLPSPVARCLGEEASDPATAAPAPAVLLSREGLEYGIEESAAPIRDDQGQALGVVLVFHDVTKQRRMGREMNFRATHDPLTGLVNRTEFDRRLGLAFDEAVTRDAHHALMYIDLDQFKLVNDACGHTVGDELLCQVTDLLKSCVRASDTLARLGGDEFGVLLEHCTVEQAHRVAQHICDEMEAFRFVHEGRRFRIGTSIGLVPMDQHWHSRAAIMQAADSSCYAAKEAGRNRVHAWLDTDEAMTARKGEMRWASRLEQAIDDNRFELYGQRVQAMRTGDDLDGLHCEVLLRLREPAGQLVLPGAFLPAAERFHLASRIDRWVVRRVLHILADQAAALQHVRTVSVNLSGHSLGDPAFHRYVLDLIEDTGANPHQLCLEITEAAAITRLKEAAAFITDMRHLGVRVALDDFGSGASSFGYLRSLPVDALKIDGQFVRGLHGDPLNQAAVRCFCDVAKILNLRTIAEYVEDEATLDALRELGVDLAQGYLLHRPEPLMDALRPTTA